jgi:uncharacterized phage protein gp47/JayE
MTIQEIYDRMKASFLSGSGVEAITEPGVISSLIEALATEIKGLYDAMSDVIDQGYCETATGSYLDKIGALIGCTRNAGTKAIGTVRFTASTAPSSDIPIPEGTVVSTVIDASGNRYRFLTSEDALLLSGTTYIDVPVEAYEIGENYNLPSSSLIKIETPIAGVTSCNNASATNGGALEETDDHYRDRIPLHLSGMKRATSDSLRSAAMSVDGIMDAQCTDGVTAGTATVIVASATGTVPSGTIEEVEEVLEEYKGAGIQVTVSAATNLEVDCTFDLYLEPEAVGATVKAAAEAAVEAYLNGILIDGTAYWSQVVKAILSVDGVVNVKNVLIDSDTADIDATSTQKIVAGTVTGTVIT